MRQGTKITDGKGTAVHIVTEYEARKNYFESVNFTNAVFNDLDLDFHSFRNCSFLNAKFSETSLTKAKFKGCSLLRVEWTACNMSQSTFSNCGLNRVEFSKCDLRNSDFFDTTVLYPHLADSNFTRSRFIRSILLHSNIKSCDFTSANFRTSKIIEVKSILDTKLDGVVLDKIIEPNAERNKEIYKKIAKVVLDSAKGIEVYNSVCEAERDGHSESSLSHPENKEYPLVLDMDVWHSNCGTTHCLAGWYVKLHPDGAKIEALAGTEFAAHILSQDKDFCDQFFNSNTEAIEWLEQYK